MAEVIVLAPTIEPDAIETLMTEESAKASIYMKESSNNHRAINPSSGACGIGQALPCSKLPCSLDDYECQDQWFTESYMKPRYSTWIKAWNYWNCIGSCTNNYGTIIKTDKWW